jgi:hypothetical protein
LSASTALMLAATTNDDAFLLNDGALIFARSKGLSS